jgi:hypothetical protein
MTGTTHRIMIGKLAPCATNAPDWKNRERKKSF